MTAAEAQAMHNVCERELDKLAAERLALLHDIISLAQSVVEAIPPLPAPSE